MVLNILQIYKGTDTFRCQPNDKKTRVIEH